MNFIGLFEYIKCIINYYLRYCLFTKRYVIGSECNSLDNTRRISIQDDTTNKENYIPHKNVKILFLIVHSYGKICLTLHHKSHPWPTWRYLSYLKLPSFQHSFEGFGLQSHKGSLTRSSELTAKEKFLIKIKVYAMKQNKCFTNLIFVWATHNIEE